MTDSLTNYPELVKEKFKQAVIASTKIRPSDKEGNQKLIFETLIGEYISESGDSWIAKEKYPGILKIESDDSEVFFGFDTKTDGYFITEISSSGVETINLHIKPGLQLVMEDPTDSEKNLLLDTIF